MSWGNLQDLFKRFVSHQPEKILEGGGSPNSIFGCEGQAIGAVVLLRPAGEEHDMLAPEDSVPEGRYRWKEDEPLGKENMREAGFRCRMPARACRTTDGA